MVNGLYGKLPILRIQSKTGVMWCIQSLEWELNINQQKLF